MVGYLDPDLETLGVLEVLVVYLVPVVQLESYFEMDTAELAVVPEVALGIHLVAGKSGWPDTDYNVVVVDT